MSEKSFIAKNFKKFPNQFDITWSSPSNIALVKYWGKNKDQTPKNTSISFTLNNSRTITKVEFSKKTKSSSDIIFDVYYENSKMDSFSDRIFIHFNLFHFLFLKIKEMVHHNPTAHLDPMLYENHQYSYYF